MAPLAMWRPRWRAVACAQLATGPDTHTHTQVHGVQSNCLSDPTGEIHCPTSFGNPVSLGMTFNDTMFEAMGAVVGLEARALWLGGAHEYNGSPPPHIGLDA